MTTTRRPPLINRSSLSDQAYAVIRRMILELELRPGTAVTEAQLSDMLGLSKSPIRTALIHLQRDGLVTITPYKETIISNLTLDSARHIYEARLLLEPHFVEQVTPRLTPDDLRDLGEMIEQAEAALARGELSTFFDYNTDFHGFFVRRHGNEFFWNLFQAVDLQMQRIRMISAAIKHNPDKQAIEHRQIFEAVCRGDATTASELMRQHLSGYWDDMVAEFQSGRLPWFA
jgi:DNA-binding GntR family transcriptional regulator